MSFPCLGDLGSPAYPLGLTIAIARQSRHIRHWKLIPSAQNMATKGNVKALSATGAERNEEKQLWSKHSSTALVSPSLPSYVRTYVRMYVYVCDCMCVYFLSRRSRHGAALSVRDQHAVQEVQNSCGQHLTPSSSKT